MIDVEFEYAAPATIAQARKLLARDGARPLGGGQSLITDLKLGAEAPSLLVDLGGLDELRGVDGARCGAMATLDEVAAALGHTGSALGDAIADIADPQVRNRATIGGSLVLERQGADIPAALLAQGGTVELSGRGRPRSVDVRKFLSAPSSERIRPGEIVTAVTVAPAAPGTGSAYEKARDPASGYAICGVAAAVVLRADGKIKAAHLGIAGAGPVAVGAPEAEAALRGKREAAAGVITLAFPSDLAASAEYRAHLAQVLTVRAVRRAVQRATEAMA